MNTVVEAARTWIGTPYQHMGFSKGVAVDCLMLLIGVFCVDTGLVPMFDPRPYTRDWALHRGEERYLAGITRYAEPVSAPQDGDIATYRFGRCVSHAGIVDGDYLIHAYSLAGCVERTERWAGDLESRFAGFWRLR